MIYFCITEREQTTFITVWLALTWFTYKECARERPCDHTATCNEKRAARC